MDITNYSIWLHWLIIQTWGPWYLLTESCQQRVLCSQIPEAFSATEQSLNVLLRWGDPILPGRPCRVSCLPRTPRRWSIPLRTPPSWRSGRSLGGIQDLLEIYLFSVLAWLICSSKTLLDESNLRKFWKINIVIGIEDWLIWDKDRVDAVTTFSYIYIIAHYGDLHADTLTQEHPNLLVTCHSRSFLSQLSCLDGILIYHACHKISWSSLWIILEILPKGITDFAHLR